MQGPVSKFARMVTYDRAGYAWSDPGPTPRTFRQIALELHTGHNVNLEDPQAVIGAILEVVEAARTHHRLRAAPAP